METEMKLIQGFMFRRKTISGDLSKTVIWVYDNGVISIGTLLLTKDTSVIGYSAVCTKFGMTLHITGMSLRHSTFSIIQKNINRILADHKIDKENIL